MRDFSKEIWRNSSCFQPSCIPLFRIALLTTAWNKIWTSWGASWRIIEKLRLLFKIVFNRNFSKLRFGRGYEEYVCSFGHRPMKNQLKRAETTLDDRGEGGRPDIDGRRGPLRWCPVVLRLDYAAKIEILDSRQEKTRVWLVDFHCVGFCPFASPLL